MRNNSRLLCQVYIDRVLTSLHIHKVKTSVEFIEQFGRMTAIEIPGTEIIENKVATCPSHTSAPEITVTVASFRIWRGSQFIVAREPEQVTISGALYIKKNDRWSIVTGHWSTTRLTTKDK